LIVEMVAGLDPDNVMPKRGKRWTAAEIGLLRAWIDQGAKWAPGINFGKPAPANLAPRKVEPPAGEGNSVDRLLAPYFAQHGIAAAARVPDAVFARRIY